MFDPTPQTSRPDSGKGRCGGGLDTPNHGRRPGHNLTNDQRQPDRNGWSNPPDGRVTGSAGGGQERSCMVVAAPVAVGIGLVALLVRSLR